MSLRSPQASPHSLHRPPNPGAEIAAFFDKYGRMVLAVCRTLLRDPEDAEDAAQQTFLSAHRALVNGTRPLDPPAWLATIARNECRARIAARLAKPQPLPLPEDVAESRASSDPETQADRREEIAAFTAALAELPERQREAVVLRDVHGLSYQEVARAMSVSPPAVESLLSRARRTLEARVRPVRAAYGAPLLVDSLRGRLEALIPEFGSAEATTALASGAGGIAGKLLSLQVVGKVAATSAVAVVTLGVGAEVKVDRQVQSSSPGRAAAEVLATTPPTAKVSPRALRSGGRTVVRRARIAVTEHGQEAPASRSGPSAEFGDTTGSPAAPTQSTPDDSGHREDSEDPSATDSGSTTSGPGSSSPNSGPGSLSSNSGPGSVTSGSGESGTSGSGGGGGDDGSSGSDGSGSSGSSSGSSGDSGSGSSTD